jgi:hypothetical protein
MASELEDFLYRLANDDALLSRYRADPDSVLEESTLKPDDARALRTGDVQYVRSHVPRPMPMIWVDQRG